MLAAGIEVDLAQVGEDVLPVGDVRLVELLGSALAREPIVVRKPDQPGDVPITFADVGKAHRDLGYSPRVSIETGIARFADWVRAQPRPTP